MSDGNGKKTEASAPPATAAPPTKRPHRSHIPKDHNAVSPYLITDDAPALITFLIAVFKGRELMRIARPDDDKLIMHAEVLIDDSVVMLASVSHVAKATGGMIHVYVPDVNEA